ncbi:MAG TPA: DUF1080 domain-containing protein [Terracidiphilus sp.]|nr:DUF1080 domain-containing protein [Terracidiphilus sp.]
MLKFRKPLVAVLAIASLWFCPVADAGAAAHASASSVQPFLGRWDMTITTPSGSVPSWLYLYEEGGALKAMMTGRWGNARALPKVSISNDTLTFVDPKEEEGANSDLIFHANLKNGRLAGTANGPDGAPWTWAAVRAPSLVRSGTPKWGAPISLFDGTNLDGWHEYKSGYFPQPGHWTVVDGNIVSPGNGPELVSDRKFQDFKLHLEFKNGPTSNSGVYLRGRYEVQIENESAGEPPSHHTGGIYGFIAPHPELPRVTGKWRTYDITLIGRQVTVVLDGTTVIDNKEIPGLTGGALDSHEGEPGPIYLQGSEKGHVYFRNIVIRPAE